MAPQTQTAPPRVGTLARHRNVALGAILALLATAAVVLVPTAGAGARTDAAAASSGPALRTDGGPEESHVAAALAAGRAARERDESRIGAAIAAGARPSAAAGGPDESVTAAAIAGR